MTPKTKIISIAVVCDDVEIYHDFKTRVSAKGFTDSPLLVLGTDTHIKHKNLGDIGNIELQITALAPLSRFSNMHRTTLAKKEIIVFLPRTNDRPHPISTVLFQKDLIKGKVILFAEDNAELLSKLPPSPDTSFVKLPNGMKQFCEAFESEIDKIIQV